MLYIRYDKPMNQHQTKYSAFIISMTSRPGFKEFPFPADCTDCSIH